jgi:hypothetical protein
MVLLTTFSSNYTCEYWFSIINYIKSDFRNRVTKESKVACANLKTNFESYTTASVVKIQQQTSHFVSNNLFEIHCDITDTNIFKNLLKVMGMEK